jgi:hypothetical protein
MSEFGDISWNDRVEEYFASTGEKAHCLSWCHKQAEGVYSLRRTWIDLPVIVISGLTGFMSAGSTMMFDDAKVSSIALGVCSLFVSILNTAGAYFGWAKRAEGHRISAIQYAKLYRFLSIEMSLPRDERMAPQDLLKTTRETYDRLAEISPMLPPEVVADFRRRFEKETEIAKPEEVNGLERIVVFGEVEKGKSLQSPFVTSTPLPPPSRLGRSEIIQTNPLRQSVVVPSSPEPTAPTTVLPTSSNENSLPFVPVAPSLRLRLPDTSVSAEASLPS